MSAPEDWLVLLKDCYPAYISWEQYQRHLAQLKSNQSRAQELGAVRQGAALLSGLLVCGKCGYRLTVNYGRGRHSYLCCRQLTDYGGEFCQRIAGPTLDQFVSQRVLAALEPAALELSLEAATHLEQERAELDRLWHQRLERAAFETERAGRHYRLVEPENRLVARQLAREWEEKLLAQQQLQEDYQRFCHEQSRVLSAAEREAIHQLAENIPALWQATTTTDAQRKEIIRQVIARVLVNAERDSEQAQITIEWVGGTCTQDHITRPVAKLTQLSNYPQLCERIRTLAGEGLSAECIAQRLNQEGYRPPKRRERFGRQRVRALMRRLGLCQEECSRSQGRDGLAENEWWLPEERPCPWVTSGAGERGRA